MPNAIEARGVVKRYAGGLNAVDGIDFDVPEGICFGILGPNGAGKTTTIRMAYGFIPLTAGDIRIFARSIREDPRGVKATLGVCPQEDNLDPDFDPLTNLKVYARYFGIGAAEASRRAGELLEFVGLSEKAKANVRDLSGGMKRRLVFARALVHQPRLLVLDEPTTGLDPQARHGLWDKVRALKKEGKTILLTTHYMEEAAMLCDRLLIMDQGRILAEGPPRKLVEEGVSRDVIEIADPSPGLLAALGAMGEKGEKDLKPERHGSRLFLYTDRGEEGFRAIAPYAAGEKVLRRATLEDLFLKLTGRELRG
jgi:lipooligosaccharide transport system ATP-binding protein